MLKSDIDIASTRGAIHWEKKWCKLDAAFINDAHRYKIKTNGTRRIFCFQIEIGGMCDMCYKLHRPVNLEMIK